MNKLKQIITINMETKKYKLPKEFAEKWLAALRSGEYPQSNGQLKSDKGYCCLGVAARVCGISDIELDSCGVLNSDWAVPNELKGSARPDDNYNELVDFLVTHNDGTAEAPMNPKGEEWTFKQLADWIETNVEFVL